MIDYDEDVYTELAMKVLDCDIHYWCSRYYIPGYDLDDLKQECRLKVWKEISKFNPQQGVLIRSWAKAVIKNHLKNLLRDSMRQKRFIDYKLSPIDMVAEVISVDYSDELGEILDELAKNNKSISDII